MQEELVVELVLANVLHLDHGLLIARADEGLDRAQVAVLAVHLELHGRPVRAEPELGFHIHGAPGARERELHAILGDVVELPGLPRLPLDPLGEATWGICTQRMHAFQDSFSAGWLAGKPDYLAMSKPNVSLK